MAKRMRDDLGPWLWSDPSDENFEPFQRFGGGRRAFGQTAFSGASGLVSSDDSTPALGETLRAADAIDLNSSLPSSLRTDTLSSTTSDGGTVWNQQIPMAEA